MKYLFPNFLNDLSEFYEAEKYWKLLCQDVLEKHQQQNDWTISADPVEMDLSVFDNYPIVGGFNLDKTKGITVYQQDPKADLWEMSTYTSESDKFSETQPITYLEFKCNLSEEASKIFKKLLEKWIQPDCSKEEMENFIEFFDFANKPYG